MEDGTVGVDSVQYECMEMYVGIRRRAKTLDGRRVPPAVLDGKDLGSTPFEGQIPIGRHQLQVRTPDRLRELPPREVLLRPGEALRVEAPLILRDRPLAARRWILWLAARWYRMSAASSAS